LPEEPSGSVSPGSNTSPDSGTEPAQDHLEGQPPTPPDSPFGAALEPILRQVCHGHLSEVHWFRTDWQRGGALTGYAIYCDDHGQDHEVVVKLPVGPGERQWLVRLGEEPNIVPRVFADGKALGGYDMAWVVMERLPYGPLGLAWEGKEFDLLVEATGRFYAAAKNVPINQPPVQKDWEEIFQLARKSVRRHNLAHPQRWNKALKNAHRKLKQWVRVWDDRPVDQWCHGDLHLGNAMARVPPPGGPALLLDFALTHPGHWVEDAVYFEHLYWARRDRLQDRKLCKQIAHQRKKMGLKLSKNWSRLASVSRALLAMGTPAVLRCDGDPRHVQAALEVLEIEAGVR